MSSKKEYRFNQFMQYKVGGANLFCKDGHVGNNVHVESDIGTAENPIDYLYLGDNVYIGPGCNIRTPRLVIGDYTKIHRNCLVFGRNPIKIGYNCWFGEGTIIDGEGHTTIGNGVGAGAHSQLWSHIRHADVVEGSRYLQFGNLTVDDDVWFVGHCIVSPIHAKKKSMALVGSVVTRDMDENHIYGGSPAKDLTDKLGTPFVDRTLDEKMQMMVERLRAFNSNLQAPISAADKIALVAVWDVTLPKHVSQFNVATRTYTKTGSDEEQAFMKFLLPEAKFVPANETLP